MHFNNFSLRFYVNILKILFLNIKKGILARRFGTKIIFGVANLLGCLICSLMPLAAYLDYRMLILLRVIQGIIVSVCWPSMHQLSGQWIPKNERGYVLKLVL